MRWFFLSPYQRYGIIIAIRDVNHPFALVCLHCLVHIHYHTSLMGIQGANGLISCVVFQQYGDGSSDIADYAFVAYSSGRYWAQLRF